MFLIVTSLFASFIILILINWIFFHGKGDGSIPYAKFGSYPIVGHLFAFTRNRTKLLLECRQRYGECFRIQVFNQSFTMILSHSDWTSVLRNPNFHFSSIDFGIKLFDLSPIFHEQSEFDADTHRLYVQYLKNREGLRPMVVQFVHQMRQLIDREKQKTSDWIPTGLLEFSHRMLYEPSTLSLMGNIDVSAMEKDFRLFDKQFHWFFTPLPRWFYRLFFSNELSARSNLQDSWLKNRIPANSSEFHRDRVELFTNNSQWLSEKDFGGLLTGFFWASLGNTIPAVFWSLLYILRDRKALEVIKDEVDKKLENDDDWTPEQLDSCIYLESSINEALRLAGAPFMTRKCHRETQINLKNGSTIKLKPGETVAWFGGASHFDPNMFTKPDEFIFDRFLNQKPDFVPGFMPFGAGKSICPGRFFAKYEIKTCVAMLLRYMEYKIDENETIPSPLAARIGFGVAPPSRDIPIMFRYKM